MADQLWRRAQSDLRLEITGEPPDLFIWEHSARVAQLAEMMLAAPELSGRPVDHAALTAAALYHDAGWVLQVRSGQMSHRDVLLKPSNDFQRDMAAEWIVERLDGILGPGVIAQAARAIRQCNNRQTDLLEAQILAEAENLDEIGPQAVWPMMRKQLAEGKTLADVVTAWERQEEYNFWQARIKDGFRFESVRTRAIAQCESLRRFMRDLRVAVRLEDHLAPGMPGNPRNVRGHISR